MNTAYVKETGEYITVQQYKDELHRLKIYCPECCEAPVHIVRQQKKTFFRVNNKENHSEGCSFYEELISNEEVIRLIESKKEVDEERLKFLIEMNMRNALNLLRKQNTESLISKQEINNNPKKSINNKNRVQEVNTIKRVHISNLLKNRLEYQDEYIVIYGKAEIEETEVEERENSKTKEKFKAKSLIFKGNDERIFRINLTGDKKTKEKFNFGKGETYSFVVFGLFNSKYLSLKIKSFSHFQYFKD
ncbi:hypothetical protein [uncultured Capnocytophaga sp.]|uniref:hypothetical protein n=1 Tax=uncultured Capnocytophaga sp. TaxID=159273 RepID=UPI0026032FE2|nr:hypothetical protein [uncultured Capnocytophaga sp.]